MTLGPETWRAVCGRTSSSPSPRPGDVATVRDRLVFFVGAGGIVVGVRAAPGVDWSTVAAGLVEAPRFDDGLPFFFFFFFFVLGVAPSTGTRPAGVLSSELGDACTSNGGDSGDGAPESAGGSALFFLGCCGGCGCGCGSPGASVSGSCLAGLAGGVEYHGGNESRPGSSNGESGSALAGLLSSCSSCSGACRHGPNGLVGSAGGAERARGGVLGEAAAASAGDAAGAGAAPLISSRNSRTCAVSNSFSVL